MENEENRGPIDKTAYEDQLVPFVSLVLELSHYSLSLSLTLGYFEFSWIISVLSKEGGNKEKEGQGKERKAIRGNLNLKVAS